MRCPCGLDAPLEQCCGRYLGREGVAAPTAERLMRSRYSAFALGDLDHVQRTWHRSTRPIALKDDPTTLWTGLEVLDSTAGGMFDPEGTVTFRAHFRRVGAKGRTGPADSLHERSRFVREDGRWWYVAPL
ncbi:YchJ family protein [Jatrophihabitans sp. YIM 134969]